MAVDYEQWQRECAAYATIGRDAGSPFGWFAYDSKGTAIGYAFTRRGALRIARRWLKLATHERASQRERVDL